MEKFGPESPAHPTQFSKDAISKIVKHPWPGNVRELRNVIERACYKTTEKTIRPEHILLDAFSIDTHKASTEKSLKDIEREQLVTTLSEYEYNVAKAAKSLGIATSTMYYKLRKHRIPLRKGTSD